MKVLTIKTIVLLNSNLLFAQPESLSKYNVVWNTPSTDPSGQMPLGNGDTKSSKPLDNSINFWRQIYVL